MKDGSVITAASFSNPKQEVRRDVGRQLIRVISEAIHGSLFFYPLLQPIAKLSISKINERSEGDSEDEYFDEVVSRTPIPGGCDDE